TRPMTASAVAAKPGLPNTRHRPSLCLDRSCIAILFSFRSAATECCRVMDLCGPRGTAGRRLITDQSDDHELVLVNAQALTPVVGDMKCIADAAEDRLVWMPVVGVNADHVPRLEHACVRAIQSWKVVVDADAVAQRKSQLEAGATPDLLVGVGG